MKLIKWEPLNDIEAMMHRALNWPGMATGSASPLGEWGPRVDICESDGTYLFKADIPGLSREDVTVTLSGDTLTIEGQRRQEQEEHKPHFHRLERSYGSFSRSFSLPEDADLQHVEAHCENGELTIRIAKRLDASAPEAVTVPIA